MMKLGGLVIEGIQQYLVCTYKLFKSTYIDQSAMELKLLLFRPVSCMFLFLGERKIDKLKFWKNGSVETSVFPPPLTLY